MRLMQTSGSAITRFAYDGADLIGEYDAAGNLLRRYVHGAGDDEPLVWYEGSGTTDRRWLHADERGSVVATSNGSGAAIATNTYDEYGIPRSSNSGRFQYTGQTWLPELGLYYYKARIYSPTLGRFLQTDPIGYGDGMNMHAYVHSDPVNARDSSGLCGEVPCDTVWGIRLSLGGGNGGGGSGGGTPLGGDLWNRDLIMQAALGHKPFIITHGVPPKAKRCTAGKASFLAPPDFDPNGIISSGFWGGLLMAKFRVAQFGTYDFQRVDSEKYTIFYSQYTPVSNVAVGLYLYGAGFSRGKAADISNSYARKNSSNGATDTQAGYRNLGYDIAEGKVKLECR
jgi:RHS repeat-associated protein